MKTIVIYKSKSGYTETYAKWISQALQCDLVKSDGLKTEELIKYDTIIYGGGLYASMIAGIKLLKNNFDSLKDKNLVVWATGLQPETDETNEIWNHNLRDPKYKSIKTFYLRGGLDYNKLNFLNKTIIKALKKSLQKKKELTDVEKGMLEAFENPQDYSNREEITPLINYIDSLK